MELGNWIIFDDPATEGVIESKQVLKITAQDDGSYELQLDGEFVTIAGKEELRIKDEKWVQAEDLEPGDLLQSEDGSFVAVDGIEVRDGAYEVFNFEVEDFHTYFVSQNGVLVHNMSCSPNDPLAAFGNKSNPRNPRAGKDVFPDENGIIHPTNPPQGASLAGDVNKAPLKGNFHLLPPNTPLPEGTKITADGKDVGGKHFPSHHTFHVTEPMSFDNFVKKFESLPFRHGGKKK